MSIVHLTGKEAVDALIDGTTSLMLSQRIVSLRDPALNTVLGIVNEVICDEERLMRGGLDPPVCTTNKRRRRAEDFDDDEEDTPPSTQKDEGGKNKKKKNDDRKDRPQNNQPTEQRKADAQKKAPAARELQVYSLLNTPRETILHEIQNQDIIRWPAKMKKQKNPNMSLYCAFHKDHGHDTEGCWQLKREIQALIERGYLGNYVRKEGARPH
nr:hypothetical protein [Serratia marcescens]